METLLPLEGGRHVSEIVILCHLSTVLNFRTNIATPWFVN